MNSDGLLSATDEEEAYSLAYTSAVAAKARYVIALMNYDRDSVDIQFSAGGEYRPKIDAQLKATKNLGVPNLNGEFSFHLKSKNYDDLRIACQTPRILIVLDLPDDPETWMEVSPEELRIRKRAYWVNLRGLPETSNSSGKTIYIPEKNVFDPHQLVELMEKSRSGALK